MNLFTERLELEQLSKDHSPKFFSSLQSPDLYRFISDRAPVDLDSLSSRFEILSRGVSPDGHELWQNWAIKLRNTSTYLGYVQATIPEAGFITIAFLILPEYWRNGFAKEAASAMIANLHDTFGPRGLRAAVDPDNAASIRLLTGLGFLLFRIHQNADLIAGVMRDEWELRRVV
jgi:ribosomal-protein-alanine N-acetyltransferase